MSSKDPTQTCRFPSPAVGNLNALASSPSSSLSQCGSSPILPIVHASTSSNPHHIWLYPQAPAPMPLHRPWPGSHRLKPHVHDPSSSSSCDHCSSDAPPSVGVILPGAGAPLMPPGTAGADMAERWERADADAAAATAAAAAAAAATTGSVAAVAAPAWAQFLCGSLSGCAAEAATLPLELTKVGRQLSHAPTTASPPVLAPAAAAAAAGAATAALTTSPAAPPVAAAAAAVAASASSNSTNSGSSCGTSNSNSISSTNSKSTSQTRGVGSLVSKITLPHMTGAGTGAGVAAGARPPWWARTPILNQLVAVVRTDGIGGLYRGLFPALMRQFAKAGLQMSLFREIKRLCCANPARPTPGEQMAASIAAAVTGQLVANPLDVLKVRLMASVAAPESNSSTFPASSSTQTPPTTAASSSNSTATSRPRAPRAPGSWLPHRWRVWPLLGDILANEGVRGLYKGASAGAARSALSSGTGLGVYAATKQFVTAPEGRLQWKDSLGTHVVVSAVSALVSTVASAPADTVKTRLMNQRLAVAAAAAAANGSAGAGAGVGTGAGAAEGRVLYSGAIDCVIKTAKQEGVRALYRGVGPNFIRVVPWQIVFFATYESLAPRLIGDGL